MASILGKDYSIMTKKSTRKVRFIVFYVLFAIFLCGMYNALKVEFFCI